MSTEEGERRFQLGAGALSDPNLLPAGIITAYNPQSIQLTTSENAARDRELAKKLARRKFSVYRTLATGPDASTSDWDEPGFAIVAAPFDALVEIAGRFDQNAIVWIDSHDVARLAAARPGFCGGTPGDFLPL